MTEQRRVTLRDVALRVGVSKMTVSAVLAGHSKHVKVSEATRTRVQEAADQMGYQPNAVARSLRRRRTDIIGFYCGYGYLNARNAFLAELIGGLQEGCDIHKKDLLLHGGFRAGSANEVFGALMAGMVDGLVINTSPEDPIVEMLTGSPLPVVAVTDPVPAIPSVTVDDVGGADAVVAYLAEKGHRRIVFRSYSCPRMSIMRRRDAVLNAAVRLGVDAVDWPTENSVSSDDPLLLKYLTGDPADRPTAIICYNDLTAYDTLDHCRYFGRNVPGDVAVIGFDGITSVRGASMQLTTVNAHWPDVARAAVSLLVDRCAGIEVPLETVLPVQFVAGTTA